MSEWCARVKNFLRAKGANQILSSLPMTFLPSSETPRRRYVVLVVAALATFALIGVTGYVLLAAPGRLLASQVSSNAPDSLPRLGADGQPLPLGALITAEGRVVDQAGKPLRSVSVRSGAIEALTDADGRFSIGLTGADHSVLVKLPGYEKRWVKLDESKPTVTLTPHAVRAAYLTYYGVADKGIRERVFSLFGRTELNAVVIDVKGDRGLIPYRTTVPAALEAGALGPVIMKDFDQLLAELKGRHVYTIARIVAFKDNVLAGSHPELAVIDTRTGKPWIDNEKLAWVDPTREEVWDYLIAVAKEAALKGFDEIQFDYVRFPTDGKLAAAKYSKPITPQVRIETIAGFLAKARKELGPTGVFLAADVFGYTAFNENDTDIGQRVEDMAPHLDYFSPMVYPSGYHMGIPGFRNPVNHSYEIVRESVRLTRKRTEGMPVQ
ncbi:MAG TPA: putative glycoside hydrolase, partial [Methylomirabilota bacterium]